MARVQRENYFFQNNSSNLWTVYQDSLSSLLRVEVRSYRWVSYLMRFLVSKLITTFVVYIPLNYLRTIAVFHQKISEIVFLVLDLQLTNTGYRNLQSICLNYRSRQQLFLMWFSFFFRLTFLKKLYCLPSTVNPI